METTRLILRDLRDTDAFALARELNNYSISKNTSSIPYPYTLADAQAFIDQQKSKPSASVKKIIALKQASDELIGSVRLHIDFATNRCELGYWIGVPHWGKGFATEAASLLVEHAFTKLQHSEILADYNNDNPASGHVLRKLGFSETGQGTGFSVAQKIKVEVTEMKLMKQNWQSEFTKS